MITRPLSNLTSARISLFFLLPVLCVQIILFILLVTWEGKRDAEEQRSELKEIATAFFQQILVSRLWNAGHGGVYCEVTQDTQPNPFLDDPERDIVSMNGKRYTKINPAYMTRQLSEIANEMQGYKFRMASLRPLNPLNKADEWQARSLREMEEGKYAEAMSVTDAADGQHVFKYLVPLKIEGACLKCHIKQGYSKGDIKGGIEIAIPMEKYEAIHSKKIRRIITSLVLLGSIGMVLTAAATLYLASRLNLALRKNLEREKLAAVLETAGATAHEMRQPMTVMNCLTDLIREKLRTGEHVQKDELEMIIGQCEKMNVIIEKMLRITRYRIRTYTQGEKILDLEESAKEDRDA